MELKIGDVVKIVDYIGDYSGDYPKIGHIGFIVGINNDNPDYPLTCCFKNFNSFDGAYISNNDLEFMEEELILATDEEIFMAM